MYTEKGKTKVACYPDPQDNCTIAPLWETTSPTAFHDPELVKATREINAIIHRIGRGNNEKDRELCFIKVLGRMMLVWAHHGVIHPTDDEVVIARTLKLKQRGTRTITSH